MVASGPLSRETWRTIIAVLRQKALPSTLKHADRLEQLKQHPPDQATVTLALAEDLCLRSYTWAPVQLGIPLLLDSVPGVGVVPTPPDPQTPRLDAAAMAGRSADRRDR
jgi:hypothetical protein